LKQAQTRQQPAALAGLAKWKELLNNPLAARSNAAVGPQGLNLDPIQPAFACFAGVCCLSYITASQLNATDMATSVAQSQYTSLATALLQRLILALATPFQVLT
jgi:hypothetical protein